MRLYGNYDGVKYLPLLYYSSNKLIIIADIKTVVLCVYMCDYLMKRLDRYSQSFNSVMIGRVRRTCRSYSFWVCPRSLLSVKRPTTEQWLLFSCRYSRVFIERRCKSCQMDLKAVAIESTTVI